MKGEDSGSSDSENEGDKLFNKVGTGRTMAEEQRQLKQAFKAQLDDGEGSDDNLLVKVGNQAADSDEDQADKPKVAKSSEVEMVTDTDLLARFYNEKEGQKLSGNDKFLRNYILNEGWKDKGAMQEDQYHKIVDDDSEKEDEQDKFEK